MIWSKISITVEEDNFSKTIISSSFENVTFFGVEQKNRGGEREAKTRQLVSGGSFANSLKNLACIDRTRAHSNPKQRGTTVIRAQNLMRRALSSLGNKGNFVRTSFLPFRLRKVPLPFSMHCNAHCNAFRLYLIERERCHVRHSIIIFSNFNSIITFVILSSRFFIAPRRTIRPRSREDSEGFGISRSSSVVNSFFF